MAYSVIFTTLCNARILTTLPHSELCHIQKFGIFRSETYIESCCLGTFWNICAYSIMLVIITLTSFFHFSLKYFSTKFKKTYFLTPVTSILTNFSLSLDSCDPLFRPPKSKCSISQIQRIFRLLSVTCQLSQLPHRSST